MAPRRKREAVQESHPLTVAIINSQRLCSAGTESGGHCAVPPPRPTPHGIQTQLRAMTKLGQLNSIGVVRAPTRKRETPGKNRRDPTAETARRSTAARSGVPKLHTVRRKRSALAVGKHACRRSECTVGILPDLQNPKSNPLNQPAIRSRRLQLRTNRYGVCT